MDQARLVHCVEPTQALHHELDGFACTPGLIVLDGSGQLLAVEQLLHHVVQAVVGHAEVEHVDHEAMLHTRGALGFANEARRGDLAFFLGGGQELDGHVAIESLVHGGPNGPHRTFPDCFRSRYFPATIRPTSKADSRRSLS